MTGPSCSASSTASPHEMAPVAIGSAAAGTAITASGHPKGRMTAPTSTRTSRAADRISASWVFRIGSFHATAGGPPVDFWDGRAV